MATDQSLLLTRAIMCNLAEVNQRLQVKLSAPLRRLFTCLCVPQYAYFPRHFRSHVMLKAMILTVAHLHLDPTQSGSSRKDTHDIRHLLRRLTNNLAFIILVPRINGICAGSLNIVALLFSTSCNFLLSSSSCEQMSRLQTTSPWRPVMFGRLLFFRDERTIVAVIISDGRITGNLATAPFYETSSLLIHV